jgi:hypothetical protein
VGVSKEVILSLESVERSEEKRRIMGDVEGTNMPL